MSQDNEATVWRLLTLNLSDKKAVKLAVKIRVGYGLTTLDEHIRR